VQAANTINTAVMSRAEARRWREISGQAMAEFQGERAFPC
jgi:hypothetical protein